MAEQETRVTEQIADLLQSVQKAQEDEIAARAQIDVNRDNLLEIQASYPAILAREALALGEQMRYLDAHPRQARRLGYAMLRPSSIEWVVRRQEDNDGSLRIVAKALQKQQKKREGRSTDIWTPLMFTSNAEDVSDGMRADRYVHGWYFRLWAFGGNNPKQHKIKTVSIYDCFQSVSTGEKRDTRAHIINIETKDSVPTAELYIKYPPFKPFPPEDRGRPPEDYLLPIGLLRQAQAELGRTKHS
jgi:hypothetical protein